VYPDLVNWGVYDPAYGGGKLTLSTGAQNLANTFCNECYMAIISAGSAGGSQERDVLKAALMKGAKGSILKDVAWNPSGCRVVNSPLVTLCADGQKQTAVPGILSWYRNKNVAISDDNVHMFDDRSSNIKGFYGHPYNAHQISCSSRDGALGLCGMTPSEVVQAPGVQLCGQHPAPTPSGLSCADVWNTPARGPGGTYTCGARITYNERKGMSERAAMCKVAAEVPNVCGVCCTRRRVEGHEEEAALPAPRSTVLRRRLQSCSDVWNTPAADSHGTWTCGQRIQYEEGRGMSENAAKCKIASQVPSVCGPCCGASPPPAPTPSGPPSTGAGFSFVTQNLFWWNLFAQRHGGNFFNVFKGYGPFDIMAFQECKDVYYILNGLGLSSTHSGYMAEGIRTTPWYNTPVLAWNHQRFTLLNKGYREVGEDGKSQYHGKRGVTWIRLRDNNSASNGRTILVLSHHGPLPVGSGGKYGGQITAQNIMKTISDARQNGEAVLLAGDFNAGYDSATAIALRNAGLNERAHDWVDQVFTLGLGEATTTLVSNTGSDHRGIKMNFLDA